VEAEFERVPLSADVDMVRIEEDGRGMRKRDTMFSPVRKRLALIPLETQHGGWLRALMGARESVIWE
jgi:hypothetical protein